MELASFKDVKAAEFKDPGSNCNDIAVLTSSCLDPQSVLTCNIMASVLKRQCSYIIAIEFTTHL